MFLLSEKSQLGIFHFIGIGGIGMSGIANLLHNIGYKVQGSDIESSPNTLRLEKLGIKIYDQHHKNNILNASYIVLSSAITSENVELLAAQQNNLIILSRAELLSEIMRYSYAIAVSGSHGKTTTTAMLGHIFNYYKKSPIVINGGILKNTGTNISTGLSKYLIAEADESDGTFLSIPSNISIITNIDNEHTEFYQNFDNLKNSFQQFIMKVPFYGYAIVCGDDQIAQEIISNIKNRFIILYGIGTNKNLHVRAFNIRLASLSSNFDIDFKIPGIINNTIYNISLPIPGKHNILNSLAAFTTAILLNFNIDDISKSLSNYQGVSRRFEIICEYNQSMIISDYAHHPNEIRNTLLSARKLADTRKGNLLAIFQPHRYSRTKMLLNDFACSFSNADIIFISDIYSAGEVNIYSVSSDDIVSNIKKFETDKLIYKIDDKYEAVKKIVNQYAKPNDVVIFMGAGSIGKWPLKFKKDTDL